MQLMVPFDGDAESYIREEAHRRIQRPSACPNCGVPGRMEAHSYYRRWISAGECGSPKQIHVRRFRCRDCRRPTSMLPDFAQPYRVVATDTVDEFLAGSRSGSEMVRWLPLLACYQRRFEFRLPETRRILSAEFGVEGLRGVAVEQWEDMRRYFGGARPLTIRMVGEARATVFGIYQCHSPWVRPRPHRTIPSHRRRKPPCSLPAQRIGPPVSRRL